MRRTSPAARGFTLVEVLVVIAIIGLLLALLLPAIQKVREATGRARCQNHLKQMGLAANACLDATGFYPTGGRFAGGGDIGLLTALNGGRFQNAGFFYQILPYLEQSQLYAAANATVKKTPVPVYFCPSRRAPAVSSDGTFAPVDYCVPYRPIEFPVGATTNAQKNDFYLTYPAVAKSVVIAPAGTALAGAFASSYKWTNGVTAADVLDGTSNTLMIAEKFVRPVDYVLRNPYPGAAPHWEGTFTASVGSLPASRYLVPTFNAPEQDRGYPDAMASTYDKKFGSAHPNGTNALLADGSVRPLKYGVLPAFFYALCVRDDGGVDVFRAFD